MSLVAVGEDGAVSFGAIAPDDSERAWRDGAVGFGAIAPDDSERAWRAECLQCWHNAVVNRVPASRDYWDYLGPYLTKTAFGDPIATARFWLDEVDGDQTPLNRVTALTNHFQLKHKIGQGNQLDSLHACYLLDVDTFVTADKAFAGILGRLKTFFGRTARVLLIDRSSSSTVAELSAL